MTVVYNEDVPSYAIVIGQVLGWRLLSRQKKPCTCSWVLVGTSVRSSLQRTLSCCWKLRIAKSSSHCAVDSRHCGHKNPISEDDLGWWQKSVRDGYCESFTRKWRIISKKQHVKIDVQAVRMEFVCEVDSNRRWVLDTQHCDHETKQQSLQWKHASSTNPSSSRCRHQLARYNVHCFLGCCSRYTADWLYTPHKVTIVGCLLCWLTWQKAVESWPRYPYFARQCTCSQVTCRTSCCISMRIWRSA